MLGSGRNDSGKQWGGSLDEEVDDGVIQELGLIKPAQVAGNDLHRIGAALRGVQRLQALQTSPTA